MKQNLLNKLWLRVWMMVAIMTTALAGTAWGQSDYSAVETSNVTLTAGTNGAACTVNGNDGIKVGTSKKGGDMTVTVPAGTTHLHVHAAAWNGVTGLSLNISGATVNPESIGLTADSGIANNPPFTLSGKASDFYFIIELSDIATETTLKFETSTTKRFVIWGVNAEEAAAKTDPTITFNNGSVCVGQTLDLGTLFESNSTGAVTYSITAGDSYASLDGSTLTGVAEGSVTVKAEQAAAGNYNAGEASATITVNAALALSSIAITTPPTKTTYTEGETFDPTGMVVTATYSDASTRDVTSSCTYSPTAALTTSDTGITVSYTENAVEKTTTQTITVNPLPKYTVTFADDNSSETQASYGAEVTLPSRSETAGYAFAGWSETNVTSETTDAPAIIPAGSYTPTANITLYPVYSKTEGVGGSVNKTTSATVAELATANSWVSGTQYTSVALDENVTASVSNGGGNTGKYYSSNSSWRFYANESGELTISTTSGELTSITITYSGNTLTHDGNVTSGTAVSVSGTSASFSVSGSSSNTQITAISVDYTISGGGTTYYWSAPVAAAVERPEITVAENPFIFSTTATITCETEGAAIKYSFDGENWNDYTEELTITATTTIYAKAVKDEDESEVASVTATKNLAVPAVAIDATGITNTNVYDGTEAGSLSASVTYNDEAIEGAAVTWSSSNEEVATIDEEGNVTLVAAGIVTFTASYAGNDDYAEKAATYEMTVTNSDPNAPGSENNPYTVAEIIEFIETLNGGTSDEVFVKGIISQIDSYNSKYNSITYWISDDGTTSTQFECYSGLGLNGAAFSSTDDLQIGDEVVVAGTAKKYGDVYEFNYNNYIVSLVRVEKPAAPTFSVAEGTYTVAQSVELSTTTEGATIYYTVDGSEPTAESTEYTEAIEVTETKTIKAIAVKNDVASDVATATYTINTTPSIELGDNEINAFAEGTDGVIIVAYNNITGVESEVFFCDAEGNAATYDWVYAEINEIGNLVYIINANESTEARTAYMKVYALDDNAEDVYSELITINQAGYVVDYVTLPFEFNGGKASLPTGLTESGLGSDYASSPKLKFDNAGDELVLKMNEEPGMLWFNIKGNSTSGTYSFKVQTSADGETYKDLKTFSNPSLPSTTETIALSLDADVRYIKWVYVTKVNGNVGLGNIIVDKPEVVTVGEAGYATYVTKHNVSFPGEVEAYITSEVNTEKGYVSMTQVTAVPKGTPVVLKNEGEYVLAPAAADALADVSSNQLKVSDGKVEGNGTIYVLAKPENEEVGFYLVNDDTAVTAGKAYLEIAGSAGVKGFTFKFDDDPTSINEVNGQCSMVNGQSIYNLAGQRIQKMQRGINIVNGKKVLK